MFLKAALFSKYFHTIDLMLHKSLQKEKTQADFEHLISDRDTAKDQTHWGN